MKFKWLLLHRLKAQWETALDTLCPKYVDSETMGINLLLYHSSGFIFSNYCGSCCRDLILFKHRSITEVKHQGPAPGSNTRVQHQGPIPGSNTRVQHQGQIQGSNTRVQHQGPIPWSNTRVQLQGPTPRVQHQGSTPRVQHQGPTPRVGVMKFSEVDSLCLFSVKWVIFARPDSVSLFLFEFYLLQ